MTNEELMNVAMDWVETMRTSTDAEVLRPELEAWLLQDPRHPIAYKGAERHWAGIRKAVSLLQQKEPVSHEALLREIDRVARRVHRHRQTRKQVRIYSAVLAALSVSALVVMRFMSAQSPTPARWVPYVGGNVMPERHVLEDGSDLFLNHDGAARVCMTAATREVALDRGELLVSVRHGDKRSFLVRAGKVVLHATGTEFSVRREATGDVAAIVREGKIEIDPVEGSTPTKSPVAPAPVAAGQSATISGGKVHVEVQDPQEIENRLAWMHGRLYLHGTLSEAVTQFNAQNETQLQIADASIGNLSVTGLYNSHDVREFADSLRSRGVRYQVKKAAGSANEVIILSAEKQHSR